MSQRKKKPRLRLYERQPQNASTHCGLAQFLFTAVLLWRQNKYTHCAGPAREHIPSSIDPLLTHTPRSQATRRNEAITRLNGDSVSFNPRTRCCGQTQPQTKANFSGQSGRLAFLHYTNGALHARASSSQHPRNNCCVYTARSTVDKLWLCSLVCSSFLAESSSKL